MGELSDEPEVRTRIEELRSELEQLRGALQTRPLIEQAKGVLMALHGVDSDTAFQMLVATSQRTNTKLRLVAQQLVELVTGHPTAG